MALYTRKYQLTAKIETTKGTAIAMTGTDGVFNIFDAEHTYEVPKVQRVQQGTTNLLQHSYGAKSARIRFRTELVGLGASGAVPAWATTFLPACGWLNSGGTFSKSDVFADQKTLTIGLHVDGHYRAICGASGTFSIVYKYGQIHDVMFDFLGKVIDESDVAIPSVTEPTIIPPRGLETATLASFDLDFSQFTVNSGGVVKLLEDPVNDSNDTGYSHACIPDFVSTGTFDPEATVVATKDYWGDFTAMTERAISLIAGAAANNTITLAGAKFQSEALPFGNRGGIATRQITGVFNTGFTLAFS